MAEDKKAFLLYSDMIYTVEKLSDTDAGKLLKHLLSYVNDRNPEPESIIIELVFEPIKLQLKRDLAKYEAKRERLAQNGKLGGRPKKNEGAEKAKKANGFEKKQIDGVSVNVNDNVNDILLEKETKEVLDNSPPKKEKIKPQPKGQIEISIPKEFESVWRDWLEYRKAKKKKPYAGPKWEKIAFDKFIENSQNNPETAEKILNQTISNNWEGLFPLKEEYGKSNNSSGTANAGKISGRATLGSGIDSGEFA